MLPSGRAGVRLLRLRESLAWRVQGEDICCPQVLHKFLEVFSCFDWDRYCLSLRGPIALDSFPNPVGARPSAREWPVHVCVSTAGSSCPCSGYFTIDRVSALPTHSI